MATTLAIDVAFYLKSLFWLPTDSLNNVKIINTFVNCQATSTEKTNRFMQDCDIFFLKYLPEVAKALKTKKAI